MRFLRVPVWLFFSFLVVGLSADASAPDTTLSGVLDADFLYRHGAGHVSSFSHFSAQTGTTRARNIALAAGLSAVLPGAGQAYNRNWVRSAVAIGLETALIVGHFSWKKKGHDGEDEFRAYAHALWSPIRYATWLNGYTGYNGSDIPFPDMSEADFQHPESWSLDQEKAVRSFFNAIRAAEEQSYHLETGAAFSHVLPYFAEQQYYELIGKYFQFAPGWDDYNGANDPEESGPNGEKVNVPPGSHFYEYDDMHERANNFLRNASRVSGLIIVNHFLAVIDAAVSAKLHNDRIRTQLSFVPDASGTVRTVAGVQLQF